MACAPAEEGARSTPCDSCGGDCRIDQFTIDDAFHVAGPLNYPDPPPTGGEHSPCWATWGVHASEVPDENWVHNLEHGGVVYLYNCPTDCSAEVAVLETFVNSRPSGTALLSPYSPMTSRFAAVSWGHRLVLGCFDQATLESFYAAHVDRAPESLTAPPPGGC